MLPQVAGAPCHAAGGSHHLIPYTTPPNHLAPPHSTQGPPHTPPYPIPSIPYLTLPQTPPHGLPLAHKGLVLSLADYSSLLHDNHSPPRSFQMLVDTAWERAEAEFSNAVSTSIWKLRGGEWLAFKRELEPVRLSTGLLISSSPPPLPSLAQTQSLELANPRSPPGISYAAVGGGMPGAQSSCYFHGAIPQRHLSYSLPP